MRVIELISSIMLLRGVGRCCGYSSARLSGGCRACPSLRDASLRETPSFHSVSKRSYYEITAEINSNGSITSMKLIWQMARDLCSFRYKRTCGYRIGKRSKRWQTLPDASPASSRLPLSNASRNGTESYRSKLPRRKHSQSSN